MKIAVINLLRIGDLLQTAPLLASLKADKDNKVTLISSRKEAEILVKLGYCDNVLLLNNPQISTDNDLLDQFISTELHLSKIPFHEFDSVIVLNSLPIAYKLAVFLVKDEKMIQGPAFFNARIQLDYLFSYLYETAECRKLSLVNLSELYLSYEGKPGNYYYPVNKNTVKPVTNKQQVIVNISTGDAIRSFSAEFFAELITKLSKNYSITITGTDSTIAGKIRLLSTAEYTDLTNQTTLEDLVKLFNDADLFISPDTGTIHLAALCKIKILGLYNISAYHHLTGAYSPNAWFLTPNIDCYPCEEHYQPCGNIKCRGFYTPEAINSAVNAILENKIPPIPDNLCFSKSEINQDGFFIRTIYGKDLTPEEKNLRIAVKSLLFNKKTAETILDIDLWWQEISAIMHKNIEVNSADIYRFLENNPRYSFLKSIIHNKS